MASPSTVPMLSPDGQVGDVPQEQAHVAAQQGFKLAQDMLSPDGQAGVIPFEQVHAAMQKGFQLKGADPKAPPAEPKPDPMTGWEKFKAHIGSFFSPPTQTEADQIHGDLVKRLGHEPGPEDEKAHLRAMGEYYGPALGNLAGGGLVNVTGEGAVMITSPGLKRVLQRFLGSGSKTYQAFVQALGQEEGVAATAQGAESEAAGKTAEAGSSGSEAAAAEPGKAEPRKAEETPLEETPAPANVVRMVGEDGHIYEIPEDEVTALEEYRAGRDYKVHEGGQVTEVRPGQGPITAADKAKVAESARGKFQPQVGKRGAGKGQPRTYRVFDQGKWQTIQKYESSPKSTTPAPAGS